MNKTQVRTARNALRAHLTMDASMGEGPWGWATPHAFDVLELMTLLELDPAAEYEFTPSPGLDWPELDVDYDECDKIALRLLVDEWTALASVYGERVAENALTYWARVLTRYMALPDVQATAY